VFPADALTSGQAFAVMDRLLDEVRTGAFYLRQPAIADMIVEAIHYNANVLGHYRLRAFVGCQITFIYWPLQWRRCPN
jgi:hypothetical protein